MLRPGTGSQCCRTLCLRASQDDAMVRLRDGWELSAHRLPHMEQCTEYANVVFSLCVNILNLGMALSSGDFLPIGILSSLTLQNKVGRKRGQLLNLVRNLRPGFS